MLKERPEPKVDFPRGHSALDLSYFRAVSPDPLMELTSDRASETLLKFTDAMSGEKLEAFMEQFRKAGTPPNSHRFLIRPVLGRFNQDLQDGRFYMDAQRGIALGVEDTGLRSNNPTWIAVAGFAIGNELDSYVSLGATQEQNRIGFGRMDFLHQFPVIVQFQGPKDRKTYNGDYSKYKQAVNVLKEFKWERAMIDLVLEWAFISGIPAAYLLPSDKNRYLNLIDSEAKDRLRLRFDTSAQRMGFRMQPNGLYGISLLSFPNLDEE